MPADEVLYLSVDEAEGPVNVVMLDMLGRPALATTLMDGKGEIKVGGLPMGVYGLLINNRVYRKGILLK